MKLLDTKADNGNTKVRNTALSAGREYRFAQLSLHPTAELCPASKAAGCMDLCLKSSGLAQVYDSINNARMRKTQFFLNNTELFLAQLNKELSNFAKLCDRQNVMGIVRLNVLSDIMWEEYAIPQQHPTLQFYDYTKRASRFDKPMPDNYKLMFSYSGAPSYRNQVQRYLDSGTDAPMTVVFRKAPFPSTFMGKRVIDGDKSDWFNVNQKDCIIGLKFKNVKKSPDNMPFVVDNTDLIAMGG